MRGGGEGWGKLQCSLERINNTIIRLMLSSCCYKSSRIVTYYFLFNSCHAPAAAAALRLKPSRCWLSLTVANQHFNLNLKCCCRLYRGRERTSRIFLLHILVAGQRRPVITVLAGRHSIIDKVSRGGPPKANGGPPLVRGPPL